MTVGELIEALRKFPFDRLVVVDGYEGDFDDPHLEERCVKLADDPAWYYGKWEESADGGELAVCVARPEGTESARS